MTRFPGGYFRVADGALELAVITPGPIVLRFAGEHLAALAAACLRAFRESGGRVFEVEVEGKTG